MPFIAGDQHRHKHTRAEIHTFPANVECPFPDLSRFVEEAATTIGYGVANVVHLLSPDKIVLGGGLIEAMEDLIVSAVRKVARNHVMPVYRNRFEVVAAMLGDDAGVQGAAAWAKRQINNA